MTYNSEFDIYDFSKYEDDETSESSKTNQKITSKRKTKASSKRETDFLTLTRNEYLEIIKNEFVKTSKLNLISGYNIQLEMNKRKMLILSSKLKDHGVFKPK
jgi:hypothetical protein